MNTRINELIDVATEIVEAYDPDTGVTYQREFFDKEKFAQSIVQACCDIFVELRTRPADLAVKDVKKHFGIGDEVQVRNL